MGDDDALDAVARAWELGVRHFDTAPLYGHGLAEERLGRGLLGRSRDELTFATKVGRLLRADVPPGSDIDRIFKDTPPSIRCDPIGPKRSDNFRSASLAGNLPGSATRSACWRFAADTQGYAAICRESGNPGEKCPKFAQGGWKSEMGSRRNQASDIA